MLDPLLRQLYEQKVTPEAAKLALAKWPFEAIGETLVDHHRLARKGFPEVVFGQGKSIDHLVKIVASYQDSGIPFLVTRPQKEAMNALQNSFPTLIFDHEAYLAYSNLSEVPKFPGKVLVMAAGTSDYPVVQEALVTLEYLGHSAEKIVDVGVAGLHRLFAHLESLLTATVIIVIAGMDGALPSVVAGLTPKPVIAVPTSIGYGASFGGASALLAMLNSCATGVGVVNIDNGFGAACLASSICRSSA